MRERTGFSAFRRSRTERARRCRLPAQLAADSEGHPDQRRNLRCAHRQSARGRSRLRPASATRRPPAVSLREVVASARMTGCRIESGVTAGTSFSGMSVLANGIYRLFNSRRSLPAGGRTTHTSLRRAAEQAKRSVGSACWTHTPSVSQDD